MQEGLSHWNLPGLRLVPFACPAEGVTCPGRAWGPEPRTCTGQVARRGFVFLAAGGFPEEHQLAVVGGWVAAAPRSSCLAPCTLGWPVRRAVEQCGGEACARQAGTGPGEQLERCAGAAFG